ncbi:MAG: cytochrome P450 [Mycolicibacterium neoaurum]|uniref:cytochrome P450 n=1 Tax=Mycolicibacterium neoaurum TaxID=1795 RepID=UPI002FFB47D4
MTSTSSQLGIGLLADDAIQSPHPLYSRMHSEGPVHRVGDSTFYAVSGWDAIQDAVSRPEDFSSNLTATMTYQDDGTVGTFTMDPIGGPTHVLATADDPSHNVHRKMIVPQLAARRIRALEPFIRDVTTQLWDREFRGSHVEWMGSMANRLPMIVVCRLIGAPEEDIDRLVDWGYAGTQMLEGFVSDDQLKEAGIAVMELSGYITKRFQDAAGSPEDTLLSDLAAACASGTLDELSAQIIMITLFSAGGESTASLIGSAAHILATMPDVQRQLRDRPELLGAFIEEVLRYEPPFRGHYRHVLRDTTLAGVPLEADSRLLLLWGAANRDPAKFEYPDQFRLDRDSARGHLAFGKGAHFCVGAALARLEARIVLESLLAHTANVEAAGVGRWLPSLLVRRLERLELAVS